MIRRWPDNRLGECCAPRTFVVRRQQRSRAGVRLASLHRRWEELETRTRWRELLRMSRLEGSGWRESKANGPRQQFSGWLRQSRRGFEALRFERQRGSGRASRAKQSQNRWFLLTLWRESWGISGVDHYAYFEKEARGSENLPARRPTTRFGLE